MIILDTPFLKNIYRIFENLTTKGLVFGHLKISSSQKLTLLTKHASTQYGFILNPKVILALGNTKLTMTILKLTSNPNPNSEHYSDTANKTRLNTAPMLRQS